MLFAFNFCITYMYIHICVHIIFKIWYIIIILSYYLLCAVHLMKGFVYEKMLQGNQNYSQNRSFLTGNEENPANVYKRTSARIGPMFGYKGLSMKTTSLNHTAQIFLTRPSVSSCVQSQIENTPPAVHLYNLRGYPPCMLCLPYAERVYPSCLTSLHLYMDIHHSWASLLSKLAASSSSRYLKLQSASGGKNDGIKAFNPLADCIRYLLLNSVRQRTDPVAEGPLSSSTKKICGFEKNLSTAALDGTGVFLYLTPPHHPQPSSPPPPTHAHPPPSLISLWHGGVVAPPP